jgi:mRNA interferase MazF
MAGARAFITRGEVYLVRLDPTLGSENRKTRPCVVVSPDELNRYLRTVIVAPMTTAVRHTPGASRAGFRTEQDLWRSTNCERSTLND